MVKRSRGKKKQEETKKQQHIIVTKSKLFKGFNAESVRNYDQKYSGKLDSGVAWILLSCGRFLAGRSAASSTVALKLARLLFCLISNTFCRKTFT